MGGAAGRTPRSVRARSGDGKDGRSMATAVEPSSQQTTPPNPQARLVLASLVGAVYVLAALAVVFYAVPTFWKETVAPQLGGFSFLDVALRIAVQIAVALGLVWFGQSLAGAN